MERGEGTDMMCRRFRLAGGDYFIGGWEVERGGGVGDGRGVEREKRM